MSQEFMDAELFADFIIEAKEHLETIEPNLLELEKAPDNTGLLNDIFRPMHSLKGASGFLGLNRINQLAHKSENILDELRRGDMVVTSEIMDIILSSTDALRQMIDNLEKTNTEGDVEIDHIISQIDAIMEAGGSTPAPASTVLEAPAAAPEPEAPAEAAAPVAEEAVAETTETAAPPAPATTVEAEVVSAVTEEAAATPETPEQAEATAPVQVTETTGDDMDFMNAKDWVNSRELKDSYTLTAFGEGHLKDFIDESFEIVENLNTGLLNLEEDSSGQDDLVNDLFRFFHNLKGNSGIIGYHDLNALTHEAETLLNNVRKGDLVPTHKLIDLLLFVVDVMEVLVRCIDPATCTAQPHETEELLKQLQDAVAGRGIALPASAHLPGGSGADVGGAAANSPANDAATSDNDEMATPVVIPVGTEGDDFELFASTVRQQMEIIRAALENLGKDSTHKESIDAIYRCLQAVKNACGFVNLQEIKVYAERTAGIVDSARSSNMDFSLLLDLLTQEVGIIQEMLDKEINKATAAPAAESAEAPAQATPAADASTQAKPQPEEKDKPAAPAAVDTTSKADATAKAPAEAPKEAAAKAAPAAAPAAAAPAAQPAAAAARPAPAKPNPENMAAAKASVKQAAAQQQNKPAAPAAPAGGGEAARGSSTIRVDHEKLDHLMNLIGELIINRNRYALIARHLEEGGTEVDISQVAQSLSETTYAMARISDDLQDTIMKVRMVPVSSVFSRFPRLVRDLSRKSGKEVDLIMEGEETELDKSVVEVIGDPLVHLIRNAVDHGIEPEADRVAKEKPPKGKVLLRAYHKGNSVAIEIEDDGKGIDPEKMREVAVRKGIITPEDAKQLDDRESMELIFAPGFSSAEKITDISGRGVGMDVVRTNIKNLKGSVNISSEINKGTRFTLLLPLTLAIIDALMVNVSGELFAIPLDAVSETTKIESACLTDVKGRKAVTLRGEVLGIVELAEMLNLPRAETLPEVLSIVVIHDNDRRLGLVVDRLLERQEIVIKPLGSYLGELNGISGATIMGDGSVILILDPHEIYLTATSRSIS